MENKRGQWGSNFGFLMAAIGSAVGLGNIWGFPYKMGEGGGGAFLLVYLVMVVLVGFAVMMGELVLGRKTGLATVGAYKKAAKKWTFVGYMGVFSGFLIQAFYCVLGGMVLKYMVAFFQELVAPGLGFGGLASGDFFGAFTTGGAEMFIYFGIFMVMNVLIVMGGVSGGIEKFAKVAMPALTAMLIAVIVYVGLQPGAIEGYKYMFVPNFSVFDSAAGVFKVIKSAAGQMFFSLSLGMGIMVTYGSYLDKQTNLQRNAIVIPVADTIMALLAGIAVMPACAAFGMDYGAGPGLLFVTLHEVFVNGMGGTIGNLIGFLFYFLVLIAAITSSISLMEGTVSFVCDSKREKGKMPRRKLITIITAVLILILGIPVALDGLGAGVAGGAKLDIPFTLFGMTGDKIPMAFDCWLDLYDMITEGILMPLGAFLMCVLIGWVLDKNFVKDELEVSDGVKMKAKGFISLCFKVLAPVAILVVLYAQIMDFFF